MLNCTHWSGKIMVIAKIEAALDFDIGRVWDAVTDIKNYPLWRSDLKGVQVIDDDNFTEEGKQGIVTRFLIADRKPKELFELNVENDNLKGVWTGQFCKCGSGTSIVFTESVEPKKAVFAFILKTYLKAHIKSLINLLI